MEYALFTLIGKTLCITTESFVHFRSSSTRSSADSKLVHQASYSNTDQHFYFCRIARLWNGLPQIDINLLHETIK